MFVDALKNNFELSTPILTEEILKLYKDYSKQYVYRLIKNAVNKGEIRYYERGIYYIPEQTFFGESSICPEQVIEKKYIKDNCDVYGIYTGLTLLIFFGITTQMPNTIEIVTNNETTRRREVMISNKKFIIKKSRCNITKNNYATYMLLEFFNNLNNNDVIDELSYNKIKSYIKENNVTFNNIIFMSKYFPSKVARRIMDSEIIYGTI